MDMLARITFWQGVITILFVLTCILLIIVVLLQKGRGGGLSGAFGGAGGHSAFGAKTGDVFTWITVGLTAMFVLVAVIGNYVMVPPKAMAPTPSLTAPGAQPPAATPDEAAGGESGAAEAPAGESPAPAQ